MTKAEQRKMDDLHLQVRLLRAMKFTERVEADVPPPTSSTDGLSTGWLFNEWNGYVAVACSSSVSHAFGKNDRTTTQQPKRLFSSKKRALLALRNAMELQFAIRLAEVDRQIQEVTGDQV